MKHRFICTLLSLGLLTSFVSCGDSSTDGSGETTIPLVRIALSDKEVSLKIDETHQLSVEYYPSNASNKNVRFSTQQGNIVSVSNTGLVTGLSSGVAVVTATSYDGNKTSSCKFTVSESSSQGEGEGGGGEIIPPSEEDPFLIDDDAHDLTIQDYNILHCWDWSLNNIKNRLTEIKEAGFDAIQTSPLQPHMEYDSSDISGHWYNRWWKLYQPLGFKVATGNENVLGNKDDLIGLCNAAKAAGIKVIVDVVCNHLGGDANQLRYEVRNFEQKIYDEDMIHRLGDHTKDPGYESNTEWLVRGAIGLPDLKTEDPYIQGRAISMLKEYIDCGVSGFRFDAAKHIETPDDGEYASNFWPNVLGTVTSYASEQGKDKPYYYGEILGTPGTNRSFASYTKYMSVTDSRTSSDVLSGVRNRSIYDVNSSNYRSEVSADKLMLWAESHDTYANVGGESSDIRENKISIINNAYAIQASRKNAASLYYARPNDDTNMGQVGSEQYKSTLVKACNKFHALTRFAKEEIYDNDTYCFINERGSSGIAIIDIDNLSGSVDLTLKHIKSGTYVDIYNNKTYTVTNGVIEDVDISKSVALLIRSDLLS